MTSSNKPKLCHWFHDVLIPGIKLLPTDAVCKRSNLNYQATEKCKVAK